MDMSPPTSEEHNAYPHVFFTSDTECNPQLVNDEYAIADLDISGDEIIASDYYPHSRTACRDSITFSREQECSFSVVVQVSSMLLTL
jgi:hypothetical protein